MTNLDEMAKNLKELSKEPRARVRDIQQTLANGIITTDENGVALRAESKKDTAVLAISEEKWAVRAVAKKTRRYSLQVKPEELLMLVATTTWEFMPQAGRLLVTSMG